MTTLRTVAIALVLFFGSNVAGLAHGEQTVYVKNNTWDAWVSVMVPSQDVDPICLYPRGDDHSWEMPEAGHFGEAVIEVFAVHDCQKPLYKTEYVLEVPAQGPYVPWKRIDVTITGHGGQYSVDVTRTPY